VQRNAKYRIRLLAHLVELHDAPGRHAEGVSCRVHQGHELVVLAGVVQVVEPVVDEVHKHLQALAHDRMQDRRTEIGAQLGRMEFSQ